LSTGDQGLEVILFEEGMLISGIKRTLYFVNWLP
jgi:hypothetical protein